MQFPENIFQAICEEMLPTACIVCQDFQKYSLCNHCLKNLQNDGLFNYLCCYQCGITLLASELAQKRCAPCQTTQPYFDETYCLDRYEGILQTPLHELKYQKRIAYSHALSNVWNLLLSQGLENTPANYLIPVPLSIQKLAQRGFNQSREIAKRVRCRRDIQKTPRVLLRKHSPEHQAGSSLFHRHLAIQGVFYMDSNYVADLQNKTVIVLDDVMTSGATLNEIARVLKDNGVSRVINWVLLRATRPI